MAEVAEAEIVPGSSVDAVVKQRARYRQKNVTRLPLHASQTGTRYIQARHFAITISPDQIFSRRDLYRTCAMYNPKLSFALDLIPLLLLQHLDRKITVTCQPLSAQPHTRTAYNLSPLSHVSDVDLIKTPLVFTCR